MLILLSMINYCDGGLDGIESQVEGQDIPLSRNVSLSNYMEMPVRAMSKVYEFGIGMEESSDTNSEYSYSMSNAEMSTDSTTDANENIDFDIESVDLSQFVYMDDAEIDSLDSSKFAYMDEGEDDEIEDIKYDIYGSDDEEDEEEDSNVNNDGFLYYKHGYYYYDDGTYYNYKKHVEDPNNEEGYKGYIFIGEDFYRDEHGDAFDYDYAYEIKDEEDIEEEQQAVVINNN